MSSIVRNADSRSQPAPPQTAPPPHSSTPQWGSPPPPPSGPLPTIDQHNNRQSSNGASSRRRGSDAQHTVGSNDHDRYPQNRHHRSDSDVTGVTREGSAGYAETMQSGPPRKHDYDVQAMETTPGSPRGVSRNPIPPPTVTVRSEFPTFSRSREQQTLTCLITVEVPDCKWRPDPVDIGMRPETSHLASRVEEAFSRAQSPESHAPHRPRFYPYESQVVLEDVTENLRTRVDNWHGLDFGRFGKLRLYGTLRVGKDKVSWQELECFLFAEMLICVKEKKVQPQAQQWDENGTPRKKCTLKGSILIKKHLNEVTETGNSELREGGRWE
jgi:hypothetical protein